jgi:hypothetical protein
MSAAAGTNWDRLPVSRSPGFAMREMCEAVARAAIEAYEALNKKNP